MGRPHRHVVLLGPQRLRPTLASVVDELELGGKIAAVTAGWQEREPEDDELRDHLGGRTVNLELYARAEEAFARDAELFAAHRRRQDALREAQGLYRLRLGHALEAVRALLERDDDSPALREQRDEALEALRQLDRRHLERIGRIHEEFAGDCRPAERPAVVHHRRELGALLARCSALAVAGGHVAVLLNRLRLFGVAELLDGQPVLAWSAGAMALAERVVLFHDQPPQGAGNAEVLERGLACFPELLPFPHARRRLRLADPRRVALLGRRFAPATCVALDEGARLDWNGAYWTAPDGVPHLLPDGSVVRSALDQPPPTRRRRHPRPAGDA